MTLPPHSGRPKGILWLASYPKSGNTWTRSFLHNLINVMQGNADAAQDINSMHEYSAWEIGAGPYEKLLGKPILECSRQEIAGVRHQVQNQIAENADGIALVKTHHALVMDHEAPTINFDATAGAIYILRNPLDVAISFAHHMGATVDEAIRQMGEDSLVTETGEKAVYEIYSSWSRHVESWTRKPNRTIHVMRYEDMLNDSPSTFRGLTDFLNLAPSEEQLSEVIDLSSFKALKKQEQESGFRERPDRSETFFRSGTTGQWKDVLTPDQIDQIVKRHGAQMERFGYLP